MPNQPNIDDDDLSRLLEIAHNLSAQEREKLTLANIKATAQEMGMDISPEKIDKAFAILQQEKKQETQKLLAAQKSRITQVRSAIVVVCLAILVAAYWFVAKRVPPFEGSTNITLTSHLVKTKAADILKSYKIFEQSSATLLVDIQQIDKHNKIHYELYDGSNQLYAKKVIKNEMPNTSDIYFTVPLSLPIGVNIGEWRLDVFIDDKKQQSHTFDVNWGSMDITLTDALDDKNYKKAPLRKVEAFKKSEHTYAICHIFWSVLDKQRGGNTLAMKWINPNGVQQEENKIALTPSKDKSYYWAKAGITLKDMPTGLWKVELWYADNKITERTFTIED